MVYDPAWDMPRTNWSQQGSFETGEIPLAYDPDEAPLICLPPINVYWLPLILGCLDQLRNPSTWITSSDSSLNTILDRANRLRQMIGGRAECLSYQLQFTSDCVLQYSTDGGTTWTDVSGWDANFLNCVSNVIIPPIPPNPGPLPPNQHACNIAGYLATEVLQASITKAVNDYNTSRTQLQFANDVLQDIAFAFPLTALAVDAFVLLYNEYTALTIADFTTASTDPVLWSDITCAIYSAIHTDGYITAANLSAVVSNICAVAYVSSTVITALCNFVSALQLRDWQGFQSVGALDDVDCSSCVGTWCYEFIGSAMSAGFANVPVTAPFIYPGFATYGVLVGHPQPGVGARGDVVSADLAECWVQLALNPPAGCTITYLEVHWTSTGANPFGTNQVSFTGGSASVPNTAGSHVYTHGGPFPTNYFDINVAGSDSPGHPSTVDVTYFKVRGTAPSNPLGTPTCP